jgi:hypothetical protein
MMPLDPGRIVMWAALAVLLLPAGDSINILSVPQATR